MRDDAARFAQAVELTTATYDRVAANYAERNDTMPELWTERMEQFISALAAADEARPIPDLGRPGDESSLEEYLQFVPVLDAGCGPGRDARALADHGLSVLGVDLSQGMLDEAMARTARRLSRGSIRYALMDLRRLELPDASCRGIWCSASLLHLPKRAAPRAMRELARVARPGAPVVVFLRVQVAEQAEQFLPYEYAVPADVTDARRFFAYYTSAEARALLEDVGLNIHESDEVGDERNPTRQRWVSLLAAKPC